MSCSHSESHMVLRRGRLACRACEGKEAKPVSGARDVDVATGVIQQVALRSAVRGNAEEAAALRMALGIITVLRIHAGTVNHQHVVGG